MLGKLGISKHTSLGSQLGDKSDSDETLNRLLVLKNHIMELKSQCEELRTMLSETVEQDPLCSVCGKHIEPDQEITIKDSDGTEKRRYHKECFHSLLT